MWPSRLRRRWLVGPFTLRMLPVFRWRWRGRKPKARCITIIMTERLPTSLIKLASAIHAGQWAQRSRDVTNDGRPDLLISCFGGVVLYHNNGDGTFTDVTKKSRPVKDSGWATGVAFGDYDGDGFPRSLRPSLRRPGSQRSALSSARQRPASTTKLPCNAVPRV